MQLATPRRDGRQGKEGWKGRSSVQSLHCVGFESQSDGTDENEEERALRNTETFTFTAE